MSDATRRDNDATETVEWLDVKAAALRLGVSERSVQRRAAAGDLPSQQDGRRLLVCVPVLEEATQETADSVATEPPTSRHNASNGESVATSALLEQLQSENGWLRAQVETHQQNEAELRRLMLADKHELNTLRERVQLLLAAPPVETQAADLTKPDTIEETPVAVENAAQDAPETRSAKESMETVNLPHPQAEGAQGQQEPKKWWKFWKR